MSFLDLNSAREEGWRRLCEAAASAPFDQQRYAQALQDLMPLDRFWTYPGRAVLLQLAQYLAQEQYARLAQLTLNAWSALSQGQHRLQQFTPFQTYLEQLDRPLLHDTQQLESRPPHPSKPYFEVLIVHPLPQEYELLYREQLAALRSPHDETLYDIVMVDNAEDALTAVLANNDLQAVVYLSHVPPARADSNWLYERHTRALLDNTLPVRQWDSVEGNLCRCIRSVRPELDHYLISEWTPSALPTSVRRQFDRVLFHVNPFQDLHAAILAGIRNRYAAPFFDALRAYSRQPKSVFHALPISRGASIKGSPWIEDMQAFYGDNIFLAETSSTQGGLDSLLEPTGAIKQAQDRAAETFGADASYFVTNGTSTSNKIVMQANVRQGDIVLVSADCHKSIPYAVMLAGALPVFLEAYPLVEHDLYGGIHLAQIKAVMLDLKRQGRLHLLRQITLTNSTFDGLIYHVERFMMEILAIKPDIIFHWDEAWFAFAHFHPLYHGRTAMSAVALIRQRLLDPEYQAFYARWSAEFDANTDPDKWRQTLYPDPTQVCLRVYATQSTHKTLSAFRQASMIHVADGAFDNGRFLEAFRLHTSTSPNYQIIASLDIARRQAALEGFRKVRQAIALGLQLRHRIRNSPLLQECFAVLDDAELVPDSLRHSGNPDGALAPGNVETLVKSDLSSLRQHWGQAEFVTDPTRVTINVSKAGIDGGSFRQLLMTRYDIQVNKTSRHTVLFLINIGATQASIDYLVQVLTDMAVQLRGERRNRAAPALTLELPARRRYHPVFVPLASEGAASPMVVPEFECCDIRTAYFAGMDDLHTEYLPLSGDTLASAKNGDLRVSASFVTPYPPGYPVIVPGQFITPEIVAYFQHIKVKEIHGFDAERGFKVLRREYLQSRTSSNPDPGKAV